MLRYEEALHKKIVILKNEEALHKKKVILRNEEALHKKNCHPDSRKDLSIVLKKRDVSFVNVTIYGMDFR